MFRDIGRRPSPKATSIAPIRGLTRVSQGRLGVAVLKSSHDDAVRLGRQDNLTACARGIDVFEFVSVGGDSKNRTAASVEMEVNLTEARHEYVFR